MVPQYVMVTFLTLSISTKYYYNLVFFGNISAKGVVRRFVFVNAYILIYLFFIFSDVLLLTMQASSPQQKKQSIVVTYKLLSIMLLIFHFVR